MLRDGELVPVNKIETAYYHKMVDDHDHRISIVIYADMNAKGEGIPVDEGKATIYYMKAINRGSYLAMNNFADLLISKECGTECLKQVAIFYQIAADNCISQVMNSYANNLRKGQGIEINKSSAIKYNSKAIEEGNVPAIYNYASILLKGKSMDKNKKKAIKYFKMTAGRGHKEAKEEYESLTKSKCCNIF